MPSRWSNYNITMATGTRGAIGELRACVDLLERGYEVFRAVSPACNCDLTISRDGKTLRVEVRTGQYLQSGKIIWPKGRNVGKYDVVAVVLPDKIAYYPSLD